MQYYKSVINQQNIGSIEILIFQINFPKLSRIQFTLVAFPCHDFLVMPNSGGFIWLRGQHRAFPSTTTLASETACVRAVESNLTSGELTTIVNRLEH